MALLNLRIQIQEKQKKSRNYKKMKDLCFWSHNSLARGLDAYPGA